MGESVSKGGVARGWWGNEVWDEDDDEDGEGEEEEGDGEEDEAARKQKERGEQKAGKAIGDDGRDEHSKDKANGKEAGAGKSKEQPPHRDPGRLEPVYSMVVEGDGMWALTGTLVSVRLFDPVGRRLAVAALGMRTCKGEWSSDETKTEQQSGPINLFTLRHQPGNLVHTLKGHGGVVSSMVLTPDEKGLVSGSWDGSINVGLTASFPQTMQY